MSETNSNAILDAVETDSTHIKWYLRRYRTFESEKEVSDSTIIQRGKQIERFRQWADKDLAEVSGQLIQDFFIEKRTDGFKPKTLSGYKWALSKFYSHMLDGGRVDENPMDAVSWDQMSAIGNTTAKELESDRGERIHPLTDDEVEKLIANVPAPKVRNELVIRLMLQTGMRAGEVEHIKLDNIDYDAREIEIIETKSIPRTVAYQPNLSVLMDQWVNGGNRDVYDVASDSPYLFTTRKKERMSNNRINEIVVEAAENANIQKELYTDAAGRKRYKITSHALRHTFAVNCLSPDYGEGTMNLAYLRDAMGHSKIEITQKYLKYIEKDMLNAMKKKGPSF